MGQGYIIADWLLVVITTLCALVHFAVLRAPDIPESRIIEHIRWIKIAGFAILAFRWLYVLTTHGHLFIPTVTVLGITLVFAAELYRTVYRLFQELMDHQYCARLKKKAKARHAS